MTTAYRKGFDGPPGAGVAVAPGSGPASAGLAVLHREARFRIGRPTSVSPFRHAVLFLVLLVAGSAEALQFALSDDVVAGGRGYWSNALGLGLDPSERFSAGLHFGAGNTGSPYEDRTRSGGLSLWADLGRGFSAALDGNFYSGSRADILDFSTFEVVGRAEDRQTTGTLGGTLAWRFMDSGGEETADDLIYSASVEVGASGNKTTVPVWARAPVLLKGDGRLGDYEFRDRAYSAGVSTTVEGSSLGVRYLRHHVRRPDELSNLNPRVERAEARDPRLAEFLNTRVGEFWRTSVSGTIDGIPKYRTTVWLSERLHEQFTLHGSVEYIRLETNGVARTYGASLTWAATGSLDVRAGGLWDRQHGSTLRSLTLGASLIF